jgi:ubiquinone/menaquinone biosynthesis C-methylase UbiE
LGTGTAQIPIEICRRCNRFQFVAVDAAPHMLEVAKQNISAATLTECIAVQLADAKTLPFIDQEFDGVISNSIVHHLAEPIVALREAIRVIKGGGLLFFRDLLRPANEAELMQLVDRYVPPAEASEQLNHQRTMFANSLCASLTLAEIRNRIIQLGFPAASVQQTSDRHWTWIAYAPGGGQSHCV